MILWLVLGILLLLGFLTLGRWFAAADPRALVLAARSAGIAVLVVAVILLALSGRLGWLFALLPLVLPLIWRRGLGAVRGLAGGIPGGGPASSGIRTNFLDMQLNHRSGALDGEVLQGAQAGQRLSQLPLAELLELLEDLDGTDRKSALLLEAYLDRRFPDWRQLGAASGSGASGSGAGGGWQGGGARSGGESAAGSTGESPGGSPGTAMSHDDALRILGLAPGADAATIKAAHLRLIAIVHPDRGGSPFLAAQVNQARDVLLGSGRHA